MSAELPVRHPDTGSRAVMTRRAWWLVVLNVLIPGSAQLLAGSRRLGRCALATTLIFWALVVILLVTFLLAENFVVSIVTNPIVLTVIQLLCFAYALLWVVLTLDALRLVRIIKTAPVARPLVVLVSVAALVLVSGGAAYAGHLAGVSRSAIVSIFGNGDIEEPIDGRYNFMVLGGDAGPDRNGLRPDSISVVSVDAETGSSTIIGIPRNFEHATFSEGSPLYSLYPNGYDCGDDCLISYLYTEGENHPELYPDAEASGSSAGIEAMRDAVEGVTGLTMQYYVLIDMQGFSELIDAMGGIDIDVPEQLAYGPVTASEPYGYFEAGVQHMDGYSALWYARSRYDGNDFERMARQRQVQEAMLTQMDPATVVTNFQAIASAGEQVVSTDIPQTMIAYFVDLAGKSSALPVNTLELVPPTVDNADPDYEVIHTLVQESLLSPSEVPAE